MKLYIGEPSFYNTQDNYKRHQEQQVHVTVINELETRNTSADFGLILCVDG